jgi:hypothetical protein
LILEVEVDISYGFIDVWDLGQQLDAWGSICKRFYIFCGFINAWGFDLLQFFCCMGFNFQVVSFGVGFVDARG